MFGVCAVRHPSVFMTWANARDVALLDKVSGGLQDQAHRLAASGASPGELSKVKKVMAARILGLCSWVRSGQGPSGRTAMPPLADGLSCLFWDCLASQQN